MQLMPLKSRIRLMQMPEHLNCLSCDGNIKFVSMDVRQAQKYDYQETTYFYYYKCVDCDKMFDERISSTGLRHLALANYAKAENLGLQPLN